jgi:hypothetical protein
MNTPGKNTQDSVPNTQAFEERARGLFREASERIDHVTAGRLRAARRQALSAGQSPPHQTARWLIPAGAFAAIALATLMVWQPLSPNSVRPAPSVGAPVQTAEIDSDLPPDAEKTDPNLYQNMDFYKWLAANNVSDDATGGQPVNR